MQATTRCKLNQADHPPATDRLIQQRRTRCHHFLAPNCSAWCPRSAPAHFAMHARTSRKPNQADHPPATDRLVQQRRTRRHHFLAPNCSAWCPRSAPTHFALQATTRCKLNQADHPLPQIAQFSSARHGATTFWSQIAARGARGARPRTSLCTLVLVASPIKLITPLPQIA